MFRHLFKLIWNKKKQNFLFLSEIIVSFLVIFAVFTLLVYYYMNYLKPTGFEYKNVWSISYNTSLKTTNTDSLNMVYGNIRETLTALPEVKEVSYSSSNYPYSNSRSMTGFTSSGKKYVQINTYTVEDSYDKVLSMKLLEGRWFNKQDAVSKNKPVVINAALKKRMFGNTAAAGKLIGDDEDKKGDGMKVIGVVADIKAEGDYQPAGSAMYSKLDTGAFKWISTILIKVDNEAGAAFESRLNKQMSNMLKNSNLEIRHLDEMRISKNMDTIIPMIICITVAGFLIINVALGLFGVLWYNISLRRGEIGLRRAVGASGASVAFQLVTESLMLATLALIVGVFFAVQFPLLNVFNFPAAVYIIAILLSVAFIYLLVIVCALYPGRQAAAIYPAVALHEE